MRMQRILAATALTGSLFAAATAHAQVDEIVVTAQKRSQSAQEVPISISALDAEEVKERGVEDASDLVGQFPNITSSSSNKATTNFNIRGIATDNFQGNVNRSVGVYIDDVTQAHAYTGTYGVFDMERVEILRGPQNTLNGRNTTGGAINFISVKPSIGAGLNGYSTATFGSFNRIDLESAIGFDLGGNAAFRVAAQSQKRKGAFINIAPGRAGEELGGTKKYALRAQLLLEPAAGTSILASFRAGVDRSHLTGNLAQGFIDPSANIGPGSPARTAADDGALLPLCGALGQLGKFGGAAPNCVSIFGNTNSTDFKHISNVSSAMLFVDTMGGTLRVDQDLGFATLTSITAYDDVKARLADDLVGAPSLQAIANQDAHHQAFQQEVRLVSDSASAFRWILGGYYFREKLLQTIAVWQDQNPINPNPAATFGQQFIPFNILDQVDRDISAFAQFDYDFTDRLTFSGGLRYTSNRKHGDSLFGIVLAPTTNRNGVGPNAPLGAVPAVPLTTFTGTDYILNQLSIAQAAGVLRKIGSGPPPFISDNYSGGARYGIAPTGPQVSQDTDKLGFDATLRYQLEKANVYFRYARGFKSGAFDTRALASLQGSGANVPVGPEEIDAYEFGVKANPSRALQINVAAFYYDQKNLQVFSVGPLGPQFLNVPSSRVQGLELEAIWAPTTTTKIQVAGGLLDSKIRDSGGLSGVDNGHSLRNTPDFSFSILGSQDIPLGANRLNLQAAFRYVGKMTDSLEYLSDSFSTKPVQTYLDLRAAFNFGSLEEYEVALFGRNLTGEKYCSDIGSNTLNGSVVTAGVVAADQPLGHSVTCDPGNEGVPVWGVSFSGTF